MSALASAQADLVTSLFEKGDADKRCVFHRDLGVDRWPTGTALGGPCPLASEGAARESLAASMRCMRPQR